MLPDRPLGTYCPHCGYDIVSLPDAAKVCPECGGGIRESDIEQYWRRLREARRAVRAGFLTSPLLSICCAGPLQLSTEHLAVSIPALVLPTLACAVFLVLIETDGTLRRRVVQACVFAPLLAFACLAAWALLVGAAATLAWLLLSSRAHP